MSYRLLRILFFIPHIYSFISGNSTAIYSVAQDQNLGISFSSTPTFSPPTSNSICHQALLSVTQTTVNSLDLPASILVPTNLLSTQQSAMLKQNRSCCYLTQNPSITSDYIYAKILHWSPYCSLDISLSHLTTFQMLFLQPGMFSYHLFKILKVSALMLYTSGKRLLQPS